MTLERAAVARAMMLAAALSALTAACETPEALDPCEITDCGDHGTCVSVGNVPTCECDPGYVNEGLRCVSTSTDGDADGDGDGDGDADGDGDGDADGDGDIDPTGPPEIRELDLSLDCAPTGTPIRFHAIAAGEITSWSWDFGDGVTSEQAEPSHFYTSSGRYTVTVTASGPEGEDTLVVEEGVRIIDEGFHRVLPVLSLGDVEELWQDRTDSNHAMAAGPRGVVSWDGFTWEEIEVPGLRRVDRFDAYGDSFMVAGRDTAYDRRIWYGERDVIDALEDGSLTLGSSDYVYGLAMFSWSQGYALVLRSGARSLELYRYDRYNTPAWQQISTSGAALPSWCSEFRSMNTVWGGRLYILDGRTLFRSENLWSNPMRFDAFELPQYVDQMAVHEDGTLWLGGSGGALIQGIESAASGGYMFEDHTNAAWTEDLSFEDLSFGVDGTLFAVGEDSSSRVDGETVIVRVDDATGMSPTFDLLDMTAGDIETNTRDLEIAAYNATQLLFGTRNGFIAQWDGATWTNSTGELTAGSLGMPHVSPSGRVYLPSRRTERPAMFVLDGNEWTRYDMPANAESSVAWPVSDEDVFLFGDDGQAFHWDGTTFHESPTSISDGWVRGMWGSSASNVWVIGEMETGAFILRYNGASWLADTEGAQLVGEPFFIWGTSEDNVWVGSEYGYLTRYDGHGWSVVETDLVAQPSALGECLAAPPSDCTGDGWGIRSFTIEPGGMVFAGLAGGHYAIVEGGDANCPSGQYRCVLESDFTEGDGMMVTYDGTGWSIQEIPDHGETYFPWVLGIWAHSPAHAYAVVAYINRMDDDDYILEVLGFDGTSWVPLPSQPPQTEIFWFIEGAIPGEFYGLPFEEFVLTRYQECVDDA